MLKDCPECFMPVSDKAATCPHCGYPLIKKKSVNITGKRRLPNGFGQITRLNGNLRNPYRAMCTIGKDETGHPIQKLLKPRAYFPSYNDAYQALIEYNQRPYSLSNVITMSKLYEKWIESPIVKEKSQGTIRGYKNAWNYCSSLYDTPVVDIKAHHLKDCVLEGTYRGKRPSNNVQRCMVTVFEKMFSMASEYEMVNKNVALDINLGIKPSEVVKEHIPFTDDEMQILWSNSSDPIVKLILIDCYTGWRPRELLEVKLKNIDLKNSSITGGSKTRAGRNRIVPIHSRIRGMIERQYKQQEADGEEYLFTTMSYHYTYQIYLERFAKVIRTLGLNADHRPHDCRVHFVTMAKKYNVDEYAIKHIVGHAISDVTESVYTKRPFEWYASEIEKIR